LSSLPLDTRNGWKLYGHPAFREQFDALVSEVERLSQMLSPQELEQHPKARFLARVRKIILEDIPSDPASKAYELGNTLGPERRHWRRAKFNQRFRIFFRFHAKARVVVYAWINDETTLRSRGARNDVYVAFARRLISSDPPDDWDDLHAASRGS
jgi:toxin YhaV